VSRSERGSERTTGAQARARSERSEARSTHRSERGSERTTGAQARARPERSEARASKLGLLAALSVAAAPCLFGCSLGKGEGVVHSDQLVAKDCWYSAYDLEPDFFAAVPYRQTLQIRVQRGNDLQEVSDGLDVLVDDVNAVRGQPGDPSTGYLDKPLSVRLPVGVVPAGTPVGKSPPPPADEPALVHMSLNLERSCHNQNIVLSAISGTITFHHMFSGDPNEQNASEKLTETADSGGLGGFDIMLADPRDVPAPGDTVEQIPASLQTHLVGSFSFYFERGQPGQPFP